MERTAALLNAAAALDTGLKSYHPEIAAVADRLLANKSDNPLKQVITVLGNSFWRICWNSDDCDAEVVCCNKINIIITSAAKGN